MFCDTPGRTEPNGPCSPGYFCPEGSTSPQSNETFCPSGFYCPGDTNAPLPCKDGSYVS